MLVKIKKPGLSYKPDNNFTLSGLFLKNYIVEWSIS